MLFKCWIHVSAVDPALSRPWSGILCLLLEAVGHIVSLIYCFITGQHLLAGCKTCAEGHISEETSTILQNAGVPVRCNLPIHICNNVIQSSSTQNE